MEKDVYGIAAAGSKYNTISENKITANGNGENYHLLIMIQLKRKCRYFLNRLFYTQYNN